MASNIYWAMQQYTLDMHSIRYILEWVWQMTTALRIYTICVMFRHRSIGCHHQPMH